MHELYPRHILPFETRNWYEESLKGVIRFKDKTIPPIDPHFQENDFTHTIQTIDLARKFANDYPAIAQYIGGEGLLDLEFMLYLHEAGEPIAGDMPRNIGNLSVLENGTGEFAKYLLTKLPNDIDNNSRDLLLRAKLIRREHKVFSFMVLPNFPEDLQPKIRELYYRFEEPSENDLVAQLANFFDNYDGNKTSLIHYVDRKFIQNYNPDVHDLNVTKGIYRILSYARNVYKELPPVLQKSWIEYLDAEMSIYSTYGYGDIAKTHLDYFKDSLKVA